MNLELPEEIQKLLNRYRELFDEWQERIKEAFGNEPKELSDNCLLSIALDEAIAYMHIKLEDDKKNNPE